MVREVGLQECKASNAQCATSSCLPACPPCHMMLQLEHYASAWLVYATSGCWLPYKCATPRFIPFPFTGACHGAPRLFCACLAVLQPREGCQLVRLIARFVHDSTEVHLPSKLEPCYNCL